MSVQLSLARALSPHLEPSGRVPSPTTSTMGHALGAYSTSPVWTPRSASSGSSGSSLSTRHSSSAPSRRSDTTTRAAPAQPLRALTSPKRRKRPREESVAACWAFDPLVGEERASLQRRKLLAKSTLQVHTTHVRAERQGSGLSTLAPAEAVDLATQDTLASLCLDDASAAEASRLYYAKRPAYTFTNQVV